jgi:hypothetical protein
MTDFDNPIYGKPDQQAQYVFFLLLCLIANFAFLAIILYYRS